MRRTKRLRLVDDVRRSLEEAILSGEMRPGERLRVAQIAEQYTVSQSTVREAFLMLERQGLVFSNPRRGTFVTRIAETDAQEICQTRALLEAFAVTLGHHRIDAHVIEALERQVSIMQGCELPHDLPRLIQADLDFHGVIIALGGSMRLIEVWSSLSGQLGALILRSVEEQSLVIDDVVALHRELVDVLRSGDAERMPQAVVRHYVREEPDRPDYPVVISRIVSQMTAMRAREPR